MQRIGKGLVTLDVYPVQDEAECLEDQVQFMIFAGSAGNSFPETVRSTLRPQPPGIPTEVGEIAFSIGAKVAGEDQSGKGALPVLGARSQLRTELWMDDVHPDATLSVVVTGDAEIAELAPAAFLDAERSLRQGLPSVEGPVPAISTDFPGQFESELLRGSKTGASPLVGPSEIPPVQPPDQFAIKPPRELSEMSGKTPGSMHSFTPRPTPSLAMIAASPSGSETGTTGSPQSIESSLARGTPGDTAEKPAPRIEGSPGQVLTRTNEATGQVPHQKLRPDAAAALPAQSLGISATVPDSPAGPARGPGVFVLDPTQGSRLQEPRLSAAPGNQVVPASARGPEVLFSGASLPADRIERDLPTPFADQPDQPKASPSGISAGLGTRDAPDNRYTAQGVGNDNSGLPDNLRATKIGEALSIREARASTVSPVPAGVAGSPTAMTKSAGVSETPRIPAEGSVALIPKASAGEVMSGIQSSADSSGHTALDVSFETMDAGQPGQSGSGDSLRRIPEPEIRIATLARGATAQIAEAVRLPLDGSIEVRLSPEELGRVRVSMIPGEAGLVVQLVAERPETLELLRRHADLLAADLHDAGYTGLEFSFSREDRGHDPSGAGSVPPPVPTVEQPVTQAAVPEGIAGSDADGALDLRL